MNPSRKGPTGASGRICKLTFNEAAMNPSRKDDDGNLANLVTNPFNEAAMNPSRKEDLLPKVYIGSTPSMRPR